MRVNIEDDLWTSGRLLKLARSMKWSEHAALGALVCVYRMTQRARMIADKADRIITAIALTFENDGEANAFLTAMISSQLATVRDDGTIHIRGNENHVNRLDRLYAKASKAGKASYAARQKKLNDSQTESQPTGNHPGTESQPTGNAPYSLLLTPFSNTNTNTNTGILDPAKGKPKRKPKTSPGASPPGPTIPVRAAFVAAYEKRYPGMRAIWGAKEGGQCKQLLARYTADELVELVGYYFAWKRPEVIRGGHHFGDGKACFVLMLAELRADIADPGRRREAGAVAAQERQADRQSGTDDALAQYLATRAEVAP